MVFIDSPGAGPAELEWWQGFAPQLTAEREVETQLVLPATASYGQLNSWIEMNASLEPARLILTHLDDAVTPGGFLAAAMTARLPVSYLATGQAIPEELEPATKARLLELALGRGGAARAAA
jgi:flagellar biosynthesis protein FlhF